jgi:hypothetical protein
MTHTFALLELSPAAYDEICGKLRAACYDHAINVDGTIDMHGIGISRGDAAASVEEFRQNWAQLNSAVQTEMDTPIARK